MLIYTKVNEISFSIDTLLIYTLSVQIVFKCRISITWYL